MEWMATTAPLTRRTRQLDPGVDRTGDGFQMTGVAACPSSALCMVDYLVRANLAVRQLEGDAVTVALLAIDADRRVAARVEGTYVEVAAMLVDHDSPLESLSNLIGISHACIIGIVHRVFEP